ncbi:LacI family DNA-binding transcriptional regulator [Clostridium sp.]|uniref:LacI family DNA-binding transcriptional regulator n=1 Tax=Clostridium sp. TaxID=1506 RepID=UPI003F386B6B
MRKNSKVTINDIAEKANTSKTTVSFYLNGKFEKMSPDTKRRIEQAIEETNYSPSIMARSLKLKKSSLIGVVVADITNPFSNNVVKGIEEVVKSAGYQILIGSSNFNYINEEKYIDSMLDMGVDGFIVQPTLKFNNIVSKIEERGKKLVFLDSVSNDFKGKWVKTNNYEVTYEAMKKLVEKGYEEFILVTSDPELLMARTERKRGFEDALKDSNIGATTIIVEDDIDYLELSEILKDKVEENKKIFKKTLIFAINGKTLQKVFMASKTKEWNVPNEVGIIGFDNWDWTIYASPSVTTIDQPTYDEGKHAAEILIEMIEGREVEESAIVNCSINWAESTNINNEDLIERKFNF